MFRGNGWKTSAEARLRVGIQRFHAAAENLRQGRVRGEPSIDEGGHTGIGRAWRVRAGNDGVHERLQPVQFRLREEGRLGLRTGGGSERCDGYQRFASGRLHLAILQ